MEMNMRRGVFALLLLTAHLGCALRAEYKSVCPEPKDNYDNCVSYLREYFPMPTDRAGDFDMERSARIRSFYLDSNVMPDREHFIHAEVFAPDGRKRHAFLFVELEIDGFGKDVGGAGGIFLGKKIYLLAAKANYCYKNDFGSWPDADSGFYFGRKNECYYHISFGQKTLWSLKTENDVKELFEKLEDMEGAAAKITPLQNDCKNPDTIKAIRSFILEQDLKNEAVLKKLGSPLPEKIEVFLTPFRQCQNTFSFVYANTRTPCFRRIAVGADGRMSDNPPALTGISPLKRDDLKGMRNLFYQYVLRDGVKITIDKSELKEAADKVEKQAGK